MAPEEVVPIAMNWVVCVGEATDWELGMMVSDASVPPAPPVPPVTVIVAVAPVDPDKVADMVVEPAETAVASPEELTVATAGVLEVQVTWLVTSVELVGWLP